MKRKGLLALAVLLCVTQIITAIVDQCTYTTTVNAEGEITW